MKFRRAACPPALAPLAAYYFDAGHLRADAFATSPSSSKSARAGTGPAVLRRRTGVHLGGARRARRPQGSPTFPDGAKDAACEGSSGQLLCVSARGGAFAARAGRWLIGDKMGLGKTIQAIAGAEILAREFGVERVLVVCPTSLKHQWKQEIARFTDRKTTVIVGCVLPRQRYAGATTFFKIVNYDVHSDLADPALVPRSGGPRRGAADQELEYPNRPEREAHRLTLCLRPDGHAPGEPPRGAGAPSSSSLTGTGLGRPSSSSPSTRFAMSTTRWSVIATSRIGRTLAPMLIRRAKSQVLADLPERLEKHFFVPMTPQQHQHHEENREAVARIVAKWRRYRFLSEADQRRLMIALQNMRMSCDSTYLLDHATDCGVKADELGTLLGELLEQPGTKVVVFSQWLRMHERWCDASRRSESGTCCFMGPWNPSPEGARDRFREDDSCRVFLATDAGGVGLNLQHASVVVNMDVPWNPAVLEQRIGRVHRLGNEARPSRQLHRAGHD